MSFAGQLLVPYLFKGKEKLRFDLPIAQRLTLGFLLAALIAGMVAGGVGLVRQQALHKQSDFYQHLLQSKTTLTYGSSLLELMSISMQDLVEGNGQGTVSSVETLQTNVLALRDLISRYNQLLHSYIKSDLLEQHPDQVALLKETNQGILVTQQRTLASSAMRTWTVCVRAQEEILNDFADNTLIEALTVERLQGQPVLADALSALRGLIRFNETLAHSVSTAEAAEEQGQVIATLVGIVFAVLGITLIGLFISNALISRVKKLRVATRAVEEGNVDQRIEIVGRDEIAEIASSVNSMLEIIAAEQKIMTAAELKDQFLASVSHELRNPLTEVFGWLEMLDAYHGKLEPEMQHQFVRRALHGCQELMHLITNVLEATRLGSQKKANQIEKIDIGQIIQNVLEHLDPREKQHYQWNIDLIPDLYVLADNQHVRQILRNLISNAIKYSPRGSLITITSQRYTARESERFIHISVKDTGPGIPPEAIPQLFQRFVRLPRDRNSGVSGSGLGLAICKQLVEAMNGDIWVESTGIAGEGSCFSFILPEAIVQGADQEKYLANRSEKDLLVIN